MKYRVSKKNVEGSQYKYSSLGSVEIKDDANPRISIRNSIEFQEFLKMQPHDSWLPLYLFADDKSKAPVVPQSSGIELDDEINF